MQVGGRKLGASCPLKNNQGGFPRGVTRARQSLKIPFPAKPEGGDFQKKYPKIPQDLWDCLTVFEEKIKCGFWAKLLDSSVPKTKEILTRAWHVGQIDAKKRFGSAQQKIPIDPSGDNGQICSPPIEGGWAICRLGGGRLGANRPSKIIMVATTGARQSLKTLFTAILEKISKNTLRLWDFFSSTTFSL